MTTKLMIRNYRFEKVAIICSLALLIFFIAYNFQISSGNYEVSIYNWTFYILILVNAFLFCLCFLFNPKHLTLLIVIIVLIQFIAILTFIIKGYYTWEGDNSSQIGFVKDILMSSAFSDSNPYPIIHILVASIVETGNLDVVRVSNAITALYFALLILGQYLLSTIFFKERRYRALVVAVSGFLILASGYEIYLMPNGASILLIPLFLFILFRSVESSSFIFILIIFLMMFPLFHPLTALIIGIIVIIFGISLKLMEKGKRKPFPKFQIAIVFTILFTWILSSDNYSGNISSFVNSLLSSQSYSPIQSASFALGKLGLSLADTITTLFILKGESAIIISICLICAVMYLRGIKKSFEIRTLIMIMLSLLMIFALYTLSILKGLDSLGGERTETYAIIVSPVILIILYKAISNMKGAKVLFVVLILMAGSLSLFTLYPSDNNKDISSQVTLSFASGYSWSESESNHNTRMGKILTDPMRYYDLLNGRAESSIITESGIFVFNDHFGYWSNSTLTQLYGTNWISTITMKDVLAYQTTWKSVDRFNSNDFCELNCDVSISRIYDGRGCFTIVPA